MERMNEILARAASRRISTGRARPPAPPATTTSESATTPAPSVTRRAAPRRIQPGQPQGGNLTPPIADAKSGTAAERGTTSAPGADVLHNDRILELPSRRPAGIAQPAAKSTPTATTYPMTGTGRSGGVASIREIAPRFAAQMPQRAAAANSNVPRNDTNANAAASGATTTTTTTTTTAAEGGRSARAASKSSAAGVCPHCHGAGYVRLDVPVGDPAFGQAVRCRCKEQQIEERDRSNLRRLSNLDPFREKTFEAFDVTLPGMREAFDIARHYANDPMGWLVFRGNYGCGKTHLAAAIANIAEQNGVPVVFAIVPDLLDHLRATFAPNSDTPYDALFDKVREVQLLVLDDFGAENSTAWATEKLFQLINYRYNYRMPTVITTNHRLLAHMDERIRSRLSDLGLVRHVVIEAADYRERHTGRPARGASRRR
jgi:DNA replication protein DnaC